MTNTDSERKDLIKDPEKIDTYDAGRPISLSLAEGEDVLGRQDLDPALNAKMHLVNNVRTPRSAINWSC